MLHTWYHDGDKRMVNSALWQRNVKIQSEATHDQQRTGNEIWGSPQKTNINSTGGSCHLHILPFQPRLGEDRKSTRQAASLRVRRKFLNSSHTADRIVWHRENWPSSKIPGMELYSNWIVMKGHSLTRKAANPQIHLRNLQLPRLCRTPRVLLTGHIYEQEEESC